MKKLLALWVLVFATLAFATPAAAGEHVTDTTLSDPSFFTISTGGGTWTHGTNKWSGSGIYARALDHLDATVKPGTVLHYKITVVNYAGGTLQVRLGAPKASGPAAPDVPAASLAGLTAIPDNFDTNAGLVVLSMPPDSADPNGSFRFDGSYAKIGKFDPMVAHCEPGQGHLHIFFGNTGVGPCSDFKSLRQSGGTSHGNPVAAVNRTAYWTPVMKDDNDIIVPFYVKHYYKELPTGSSECVPLDQPYTIDTTHVGHCVGIPNGMTYVWGYDMASGTGGPAGGDSMRFECQDAGQIDKTYGGKTNWPTLDDMVDDVNAAGGTCPIVYSLAEGPNCWDGTYVDTSNHRRHVVNDDGNGIPILLPGGGHWARCQLDHPYLIPHYSIQQYYLVNPEFYQHKWHLSCDDQMTMAMKAGTCLHIDYKEAWSPTVKNLWQTLCIDAHKSCSAGDIGDGRAIPQGNFVNQPLANNWIVPLSKYGESRYLRGNGTFEGEITAVDAGEFEIIGENGWTGDITYFSLTDQPKNYSHGTVSVHGSVN